MTLCCDHISNLVLLLTLHLQRLLLKNPFIPLALRLTVLCFSLASLAVAAQIFTRVKYVNSDPDPSNQCAPRASTYMAIIVGVIAIPYSGYVTWDEYMSKPSVFLRLYRIAYTS